MHHVHRTATALTTAVLSTASALALAVAGAVPAAAGHSTDLAPAGAHTLLVASSTAAGLSTGEAGENQTGDEKAGDNQTGQDQTGQDQAGKKVKYYVVRTKPNGEKDFLFDIAQRLLGDGDRFEEIFQLNKGRTQPDGGSLTDPAVLLPGWVLRLPDDAKGEGVTFGVLPKAPATGGNGAKAPIVPYYVVGRTPDGETEYLYLIAERFLGDGERHRDIFKLNKGRVQPGGAKFTDPNVLEVGWVLRLPPDAEGKGLQHGRMPRPTPVAEASGPSAPVDTPASDAADGPSWLVPALIAAGAVVVLGGAVLGILLLVRRRRAGREEPFDDSLLRTDTSAAWMVDRALRVLLAACERDGQDPPTVTGVFIEGGAMRLRLGSPASPAPAPWVANEDGQSWSAPLARLQSAPASEDSTARFARLVTIGVGETGRVLVDFASARGVISLDGPTRARHEVLRRWLGELTGNPWSNDPRVVMVGNGLPQPELAERLSAIEQVIPELDAVGGGVLVLSQAPSVPQQDLLAARFATPGFGWVVIVLGETASAKWRITATEDGWLRSGFLPDVRYTEQAAVRRAGE